MVTSCSSRYSFPAANQKERACLLEAGQLELHRHPLDVSALVLDIFHRVVSPQEKVRLELDLPASLPVALADPERLERAFIDLLANALKYSAPETPVVVRVAASEGQVVVSVADQGVGIAPEDLLHIFERFYHPTTARRSGGLGLYITRLIVQAHGGHIWVESEEGKGSTFPIALPLA